MTVLLPSLGAPPFRDHRDAGRRLAERLDYLRFLPGDRILAADDPGAIAYLGLRRTVKRWSLGDVG